MPKIKTAGGREPLAAMSHPDLLCRKTPCTAFLKLVVFGIFFKIVA